MIEAFKKIANITWTAIQAFLDDNGFQFSAAVSFYTLFSLAPITLILAHLAGIFFGDAEALNKLTDFLAQAIGEESAQGVVLLTQTIQTNTQNVIAFGVSILFLFISATTIFIQFKNSFNRIFHVIARPDVGLLKLIRDRVLAFVMILTLGLVLAASLVLDSLMASLLQVLLSNFETVQLFTVALGSNLIVLLTVFLAVWMLYYLLPDVRLKRKPLIYGSMVTTILLVLGKFGVALLIGNSSLNNLSGASSSIIILMLWVYYSGIIIFFGMELIKALAELGEGEIVPGKFARLS